MHPLSVTNRFFMVNTLCNCWLVPHFWNSIFKYMEFADKLRHADRKVLIERNKRVYASIGMRLSKLERDGEVIDIDPSTIFGLSNKDGCMDCGGSPSM